MSFHENPMIFMIFKKNIVEEQKLHKTEKKIWNELLSE